MCIKKFINHISLTRLTLKGMGKLYFIPYVFLFIIMPLLTKLDFIGGYPFEVCYSSTYIHLQVFLPFFAIWWTLFGFREYIEGESRELLLVYKKSIAVELLIVFIFYCLHICALFCLYCIIYNFNYFNCIFIFFVQSFAFFSICCSIAIFFKNIAIPFVIALCYEIFCMSANANFVKFINMLSEDVPKNISEIIYPYIFILIGGIIIFTLANFKFKKL